MTYKSTDDGLDIPPQFDRRPNGRCRAYWIAHDRAHKANGHEWAMKNYQRFIVAAAKMDKEEGVPTGCRFPRSATPPAEEYTVRTRTRRRP